MTALGKTLVFFNLLFSLVTGGLIVMVFLTRTNWKVGMEAAVQETKAAQAAVKAEQAQRLTQKSDYENSKKQYEAQIATLNAEVLGLNANLTNLRTQNQAERTLASTEQANSQAASKEIAKLQTERNQMAEHQKALNDQLAKASKDNADMSARETYARLRGDALEKDLGLTKEELSRVRRKYEELAARNPGSVNPPAQPNLPRAPSIDTTGRVTGVDGNVASVSLGSDNGIERGHILQVYRMSPNPIYLGTLTINQVQPHQAAGFFEPAGRGKTISKDDTVDTKIIR